jgi:aryl-alcohol dehydrogenase-like predicted oxidoreductase
MEEIVRAFNYLIEQKKTFYWGTSEWSAQQITDAHRVAERLGLIAPIVEQPEYSMLQRERFEKEYFNLYRDFKLGTTIWSPLAGGILTGKYSTGIPEGSRLSSAAPFVQNVLKKSFDTPEGRAKVERAEKIKPIADRLGCTSAQLALAWCVKNPNVSTVITGASRPSQVIENIKCLEFVDKLTPEIMDEINVLLGNTPKKEPSRF